MARHSRYASRLRRHRRIRKHLAGTPERPRMNVFRSLSHIYVQIIDDEDGRTLVQASSREAAVSKEQSELTKSEQARKVGELAARRALEQDISQVVFDRGGYQYIGRVKALADGAREAGLKF
ncbi:MAG: 50S ribosomal protein L18 [Kiloniellales bacterium]|nr:50S ribosomal protein L18 [Kiloniellales bacterium]